MRTQPATNAEIPAPGSPGSPGLVALQRSQGAVRIGFKGRNGATELAELYQQGCYKVRFPSVSASMPPEAVLINTAGGLTDGDRLDARIAWQAETRATVTSQAAERIYRSRGEPAHIHTRLEVGSGAHACWMPQETIVFDGGRVERRLDVSMQGDARLFAAESLVFGRAAMGETLRDGLVGDRWRIRIDGRLVFADSSVLNDAVHGSLHAFLQRTATGRGQLTCASIVLASRSCEESLEPVRRAIDRCPVIGGASCLGPLVTVRLLAANAASMRTTLIEIFKAVHEDDDLSPPRAWTC